MSFYNALKMADDIPTIKKAGIKIKPFVNFIQTMRSKVEFLSVSQLLREIIEETAPFLFKIHRIIRHNGHITGKHSILKSRQIHIREFQPFGATDHEE